MNEIRKYNIGFLSYWNFPRGLAYVTLSYAKMLNKDHNVFIFQQGDNPKLKEFQLENVNITEYPAYIVPKDIFKTWLIENKINAVFFNEYKQWNDDENELTLVCKELGIKTFGYLVLERFSKKQANDYDRLICPTLTQQRFYRQHKVRKFSYIPYSIDLTEFPNPKDNTFGLKTNEKFTFFHPGGCGGVSDRKNTKLVINAFNLLLKEHSDVKLIITSQKKLNYELNENIELIDKNLDREELIKYYYKSDAIILPSRWETVGIPILEGMAAGKPIVTTNVPPMNEFVVTGLNGYVCSAEQIKVPGITVFSGEVSDIELYHKLEMCLNRDLSNMLGKNSRRVVEDIYNLEKNKKYMLDFINKELY